MWVKKPDGKKAPIPEEDSSSHDEVESDESCTLDHEESFHAFQEADENYLTVLSDLKVHLYNKIGCGGQAKIYQCQIEGKEEGLSSSSPFYVSKLR